MAVGAGVRVASPAPSPSSMEFVSFVSPASCVQYHPDVCKDGDRDNGVQFQKINIAYHILMNNMREVEERLEYWRLKYGLADQDLDRYRHYLNEDDDDDDDWLDM